MSTTIDQNISATQEDKSTITLKTKKRAPTALTVECGVCSGPAPDHLHFGARCCYSCRAFFRRTAPRKSSLRCRSGLGECDVAHRNKKCISCRYEKCIRIGMNPDLVQGSRKKDSRDDNDEEDEIVEEEDQEETDNKTGLNLSAPLLSTDHVISKPNKSNSSEVKNHPEQQIMMCKSNGTQSRNFAHVGSIYQQIENKRDMINSKGVNNLSSPFYQQTHPYHNFSYPYNLPESNIHENKIRHPYSPLFGSNTSFEDRRDLARSPQYYPNHFQTDELGQKYEKLEAYKDQLYSSTKLGVPKEEREIKREPLTYFGSESGQEQCQPMQPPRPENSGKREEILCQRTSVITRTNQADLQYKARMLNYEGSILRHTGALFSYHASLLEKERKNNEQQSVINNNSENKIKKEKTETSVGKDNNCLTEDLANQMFIEAQELLKSSPWISNLTGTERLSENKQEESSVVGPTYADDTNKYNDVDNITDIHFTSADLAANMNHYPQAMTYEFQSCSEPKQNMSKLASDINSRPNTKSDQIPQKRSVIKTPDNKMKYYSTIEDQNHEGSSRL